MTKRHNKRVEVERRKEAFRQRPVTRIWQEDASADNPYIADKLRCHGYDLIELAQKRSFVDVLYLLFRGELPSREQTRLLETCMVLFINPGPRHPATRAAMNASVSNADVAHLLPIAQSVISNSGVEQAIRFLRKHSKTDAGQLAVKLLAGEVTQNDDADCHIAPGFGSSYGTVDSLAQQFADQLLQLPGEHAILAWGNRFAQSIHADGMGWLMTGVVAAVLAELGFQPRAGAGLYQYLSAPGLLAHGLEMSNKPLTAMPFIADENYVIEK